MRIHKLRNITGFKGEEFKKIVEKVRPEWQKVGRGKKCNVREI
jgi:hypothetical protein